MQFPALTPDQAPDRLRAFCGTIFHASFTRRFLGAYCLLADVTKERVAATRRTVTYM